MFLKYTFHAILTTGCLILKQFKYTNLEQQYAFFGSVKTKPYYTSSDLQGDIWSWQHYRHSESRSWPHKEPWPQWRGNSLLSLESMLSLVLGEPMLYHCWEEPEPPGEPGYSKCWSHTDKESVANCVKFIKNMLELTVDYRPWRGSMLKTFLRRQMGTQLAPSIQLCQYKQYAKEVGIFPTASGWMKWQMSLCMNWMLHFPELGQQTLTVFFLEKTARESHDGCLQMQLIGTMKPVYLSQWKPLHPSFCFLQCTTVWGHHVLLISDYQKLLPDIPRGHSTTWRGIVMSVPVVTILEHHVTLDKTWQKGDHPVFLELGEMAKRGVRWRKLWVSSSTAAARWAKWPAGRGWEGP